MAIPSALFLVLATAVPQAANPITAPPAPAQNPVTPEKAVLGKILFWDEQLSSDDTMACGTCHISSTGFADPRFGIHPGFDGVSGTADDRFTSPGVIDQDGLGDYVPSATFRLRRQLTRRKTPDVFTSMYTDLAFWDGRGENAFTDPVTGVVTIPSGASLESQAAGPPLADAEMAHEARDWPMVVAKISDARPLALASDLPPDMASAVAQHPDYPALFEWAFGSPGVSAERIIFAIATYERTLVPDQAPWALWTAGQSNAMTPAQVDGFNQFNSVAGCHQCHPTPFFTDSDFHNTGLRPIAEDGGREEITGVYADRGKFKTPSLLNAGLRPRYFHTGEETELFSAPAPPPPGSPPPPIGGVAGFYLQGGGPNLDNKDPLLLPLAGQPGVEMHKIMDFVENALTDPRVAAETYPFDRPTLRSERELFGSNLYGTATPGAPGVEPLRLLASVPAVYGSDHFKVGLAGGPAGATALVAASWHEGFGTPHLGAAIWIGPVLRPLIPAPLHDDGSGNGYATVWAAIPDRASLAGRTIHVQAFLPDPQAPSGMCATEAARFQIY